MGKGLKFDDILYNLVRVIAWVLTHLVCRYQVSGQEHVPRDGTLLVVANHLSWYDPLLLGVALPRRVWFYTKVDPSHTPEQDASCVPVGGKFLVSLYALGLPMFPACHRERHVRGVCRSSRTRLWSTLPRCCRRNNEEYT
jgi:hypothetical protein